MKRILVISEKDSCRSQMAKGWLSYYGRGWVEVLSAGVTPTPLNPYAAYAMSQEIIDISKYKPMSIAQVMDQEFDFVIVLSSDTLDILPAFKGNPRIYEYHIPDIAVMEFSEDEKTMAYEQLRDELEDCCFDFIHQNIKALI